MARLRYRHRVPGTLRPTGTKRPTRRYRLNASLRITKTVALAWGKATTWCTALKSDPGQEFLLHLAGLVRSIRHQKDRASHDYRDLLAQLRRIEVSRQRGVAVPTDRVIGLANRLDSAGRHLTAAHREEIAAGVSANGTHLMSEAQKAIRRERHQRRKAHAARVDLAS